jgi:hypothetical protein
MKKDILRQIALVVTFVFMLVMNTLATTLPLGGKTTGQISDLYKVVFVPAGYVFSIWGVIYLGLLAFTIYHSLPSQRTNPRLQKIGWLAVISNILNGIWIILWQFLHLYWTVPVMIGLFITLSLIYLRLNIGKEKVSKTEKWLVNIPHSVYFGWITIATIANITDFLYTANRLQLHWGILSNYGEIWAIVLLAVGVVIAALMAFTRRDVAYLAVLVWAFAGIGQKWMSASLYPSVVIAAFIAAGLVLLLILYSLLIKPKNKA